MKKLLLAVMALALVAAACGDSGSGDDQAVADAIAEEVLAAQGADGPITEEDAQCIGQRVVDDIGVDRLAEIGITADSEAELIEVASAEEIDTVVDITIDCVDFSGAIVGELGGQISEESAECLVDGLPDDFLRDAARAGITGDNFEFGDDPAVTEAFVELITTCLSPEEIAELGGG